jgi:integrase
MKRLETVGPKTINNEVLPLVAVLKSARLWAPLQELYEPLPVSKHGPSQALSPEQTAKLIETAMHNDGWFVALCATVLAYATGCRSGEIKKLQLRDLILEREHPYIHLRAEITKGRRDREPALNDLGLWSTDKLLTRARLLGATQPDHYLLPADLSKHTKKALTLGVTTRSVTYATTQPESIDECFFFPEEVRRMNRTCFD